jgi:hypothetical protein
MRKMDVSQRIVAVPPTPSGAFDIAQHRGRHGSIVSRGQQRQKACFLTSQAAQSSRRIGRD